MGPISISSPPAAFSLPLSLQVRSLFPSDRDGCSNLSESAQDQAVVALRGNCTFYTKALNAQSANATFIVLVFNETDLVRTHSMWGSCDTCE